MPLLSAVFLAAFLTFFPVATDPARAEESTDGYCRPNRVIVGAKLSITCSEKTHGLPQHVNWFIIPEDQVRNNPEFVNRAITLATTAMVADLMLRLYFLPAKNPAEDFRVLWRIEMFK